MGFKWDDHPVIHHPVIQLSIQHIKSPISTLSPTTLGHQLPHLQIMKSCGGKGHSGKDCASGRNALIHGGGGHHGGIGLGQGGGHNDGCGLGQGGS